MGRLSRFLVGLILVEAPVMLGSNRAIFWSMNAVLAAIALFFFILSEWKGYKRGTSDWSLPQVLLALLALPAVWMGLQIVPGVPVFLAHPVWQSVPQAWATISINPHQTVLALMWWLGLWIGFIALRAGTRRGGSRFYLRLMMSVALAVGLFGLASIYFDWQSLGIAEKTAYVGWVTGTFVNRNSAASFFVIGITIATVLGLEAFAKMRERLHGTSTATRIFLVLSSNVSIYIGVGVVMILAALQTGSRAGLASLLISVSTAFFLVQKGKRKFSLGFPIALVVGLTFLFVVSNALFDRAREGAGSSWARIDLVQEATAAIADRPLLGHGGGAYQSVEPLYHLPQNTSELVWNRAHNSYVEAAANMGLPVTLVWLGLAVWLVWRLYQAQHLAEKVMPATAVFLSVILGEGLHAFVDFSLQMQAIALYVVCILGLSIGETMALEKQT